MGPSACGDFAASVLVGSAREGGNTAPVSVVPPLFSPLRSESAQPGGAIKELRRARSLSPALLTGRAESFGARPLIWSGLVP